MGLILLVMDSCRIDSFQMTEMFKHIKIFYPDWFVGKTKTYQSHKLLSHGEMFTGRPLEEISEECPIKDGFPGYRLTIPDDLNPIVELRERGVQCQGIAGFPALIPKYGFDIFKGKGYDYFIEDSFVDDLILKTGVPKDPFFLFLLAYDTHYPYGCGMWAMDLIKEYRYRHDKKSFAIPDPGIMKMFQGCQIARCDGILRNFRTVPLMRYEENKEGSDLEKFSDFLNENWSVWLRGQDFIITADHGELFGEDGRCGHFGWDDRDEVMSVPWISNIAPPPESLRDINKILLEHDEFQERR